MKKADLEKLKGKKLDVRTSQESAANRFGGASRIAKEKRLSGGKGESLLDKLVRQALEKK